jgi:hypothetical protein
LDARLERQFNTIVGITKSGKSTFLANLAKKYLQNVVFVKHISAIDDEAISHLPLRTIENFRSGNRGSVINCKMAVINKADYKIFLAWAMLNLRNCLLIIDDATILERDRMSENLQTLVTMRRFYGLDIFLAYHGISMFPIDQFVHLNYLLFFNTTDNFEYKKNKIPIYPKILQAVQKAQNNFLSTDVKIKYKPEIIDFRASQ